jgi:N-acetyl-gamma-glutamyl-phosphate reductase
MYKVYVDGQEGTTGLVINERLTIFSDIEIIKIDSDKRKDPEERRRMLNAADVAFLCLPDTASMEAASMVTNPKTCLIDASTAYRTHPDWAYGIPELDKNQRDIIRKSKRIANPGCHATGFALLVYPLISQGILSADYPVTCQSITGYSGAGKKMISLFEAPDADLKYLNAPRPYALGLKHKHLPEMQKYSGLANPPLFMPVIGNFYKGMAVSVPLFPRLFKTKMTPQRMQQFFADYYAGEQFIKVLPFAPDANVVDGFLNPQAANDTNNNEIIVFGHDDQIVLVSRLDNLGKGASGAAIQNMNIVLGFDECTGLV